MPSMKEHFPSSVQDMSTDHVMSTWIRRVIRAVEEEKEETVAAAIPIPRTVERAEREETRAARFVTKREVKEAEEFLTDWIPTTVKEVEAEIEESRLARFARRKRAIGVKRSFNHQEESSRGAGSQHTRCVRHREEDTSQLSSARSSQPPQSVPFYAPCLVDHITPPSGPNFPTMQPKSPEQERDLVTPDII